MTSSPRPVMNAAQRAFAITHLNLARHQAHGFSRLHGIPFDELIGPAYEGLCKAAIGFDSARGWKPSSYVVPKVKGELLHFVRDYGYLLRIPYRLRELWLRGRRFLSQGWTDQQIANHCGVGLEDWLDCRRACGLPPLPLTDELLENEDFSNEDFEDERPSQAIVLKIPILNSFRGC